MESYTKWRKMLFDVAKINFTKIVDTGVVKPKLVKDGIIIENDYNDRYWTQGICSCNKEAYEQGPSTFFDFVVSIPRQSLGLYYGYRSKRFNASLEPP